VPLSHASSDRTVSFPFQPLVRGQSLSRDIPIDKTEKGFSLFEKVVSLFPNSMVSVLLEETRKERHFCFRLKMFKKGIDQQKSGKLKSENAF
jgi:hypothetical protein